jgi:hypothetical protein
MELLKNALLFWALVFFVPGLAAETGNAADLDLKKRIVGTWHSEYEWVDNQNPDDWMRARGIDIYSGGGILEGSVDYTFPNKQDRFEYKATWDIRDNILIIEITEIVGDSYLSIGTVTRDTILHLSASTLELQAEDGSTMTLRR